MGDANKTRLAAAQAQAKQQTLPPLAIGAKGSTLAAPGLGAAGSTTTKVIEVLVLALAAYGVWSIYRNHFRHGH